MRLHQYTIAIKKQFTPSRFLPLISLRTMEQHCWRGCAQVNGIYRPLRAESKRPSLKDNYYNGRGTGWETVKNRRLWETAPQSASCEDKISIYSNLSLRRNRFQCGTARVAGQEQISAKLSTGKPHFVASGFFMYKFHVYLSECISVCM